MQSLLQDLRVAARQLLRHPGYAAATILTLGLSLGATTTIFSVVSGVLLRPLPFPDASRLITICERNPQVEGFCIASPPDVESWRDEARTIRDVGLARDWSFRLTDRGQSVPLYSGVATGSFFTTLGVRPALGRLIAPEEYGPGHRVAMLSDAAWRNRFGAEPGVVGRSVQLDGTPTTIVGVLPPGLAIPHLEDIDLWVSLPFDPHDEDQRGWRGFKTVARLAPGVSPATATAELRAIADRLAEAHPETNQGWVPEAVDLHESLVGNVRARLLVFLGAVGLLLLLGCANLANLMLARVTSRGPELSIRAAIGAGRRRLAGLLLLETLMVVLCGTALGLFLAWWGVDAFLLVAPPGIPRLAEVAVDWRVILFALGLTIPTLLLVGASPALRGARAAAPGNLPAARVARGRARAGPVVVESAIAVMLLVGAGLLGRSFLALTAWDPGFERTGLLVAWTGVPQSDYPTDASVRALYQQALEGVAALPGVQSVSLTSGGPGFGGEEPGMARAGSGDSTVALWRNVGPAYFATLGLPLRAGRDFTPSDRAGAEPVAVVNETMARRLWPGQAAVGQHLVMTEPEGEFTVVGVAADIRPLNPDAPVRPEVYWPFLQRTRWGGYLVVRTSGDASTLPAALARRLGESSAELVPLQVSSLDTVLARRLVSPRFNLLLLAAFAGVALLLAAVGVGGLVAYRVSHRTHEIGIRLALGATTGAVVRELLREGTVLVLAGIAGGTLGALALSRFLRSLLSGTSALDPATFGLAILAMSGVGILASWLSARRASRVDVLAALRRD